MMTTASPRAYARPASIADSLPKLRLSDRCRTAGVAGVQLAQHRQRPSRLPSSTRISSTSTRRGLQDGEHLLDEHGQDGFLVVARHDDRQQHDTAPPRLAPPGR